MKSIIRNIKLALTKMWYFFASLFKWNRIKKILYILSCFFIVALIILFVYKFTELSQYFTKDNEQGELFKVCLTVIAGIGALIALYYSARRVYAMEKGNVDTRFNNAVGHLGSDNPTVVLGGIHALHQIAVKHKSYTQVVHNLFCRYLRENSAKLYENIDFEKTPDKCPVIIQTLIDYLFRPYNDKDSVYKDYKSDLSFSTLKNCNFIEIKINNVCFNHSVLENCHFGKAILTGCDIRGGTLIKCYFFEGTLIKCGFVEGILTRCDFTGGTLTECNFMCGTLTECSFQSVTLIMCRFMEGCTLIECDFSDSTLTECNFSMIRFWGVTREFNGSVLTECVFERGILTKCNFEYGTLTKCVFGAVELFDCEFENARLADTELPKKK